MKTQDRSIRDVIKYLENYEIVVTPEESGKYNYSIKENEYFKGRNEGIQRAIDLLKAELKQPEKQEITEVKPDGTECQRCGLSRDDKPYGKCNVYGKMYLRHLWGKKQEIEKLEEYKPVNALSRISYDNEVLNKINELVEAVNKLLEK